MNYYNVVTLINGGAMNTTSHTLNVTSAYAVTKFKREIDRLYNEWVDRNNGLIAEAGITEGADAFFAKFDALKAKSEKFSAEEKKEFDEMNKKNSRLVDLRVQLLNDEVSVNVKPMPFEDWFKLKNENKELKFDGAELYDTYELILENILWKAPED